MINLDYKIKDKQNLDKIKLDIKFEFNNKEVNYNYSLKPIEIPPGNLLFKIIYNDYLDENMAVEQDMIEKITNFSLKYQILSKYTALYAEIEFPNKNTEEIKLIKLKQNDNIQIPLEFNFPPELNQMSKYLAKKDMKFEMRNDMMDGVLDSDSDSPENEEDINKILNSLGINNLDKETIKEKKEEELNLKNNNDLDECNKNEILNQKKNDNLNEKNIEDKKNKDKDNSNKKNDKKKITDIGNDKKKIMEIINTQDFLDGFWCLNEKTNIIK